MSASLSQVFETTSHNTTLHDSIKALRLHPAINLALSRYRLLYPHKHRQSSHQLAHPPSIPAKLSHSISPSPTFLWITLSQHLMILKLLLDHSQPASLSFARSLSASMPRSQHLRITLSQHIPTMSASLSQNSSITLPTSSTAAKAP